MKRLFALWLWIGFVICCVTIISGSPNPIVGWIIASVMIWPPLIWIEWDVRRRDG